MNGHYDDIDLRRTGALIAVLALVGLAWATLPAAADPEAQYAEEGFTASGRAATPTVDADVGAVDCGTNVGGACIPFPGDDLNATGVWIEVQGDDTTGEDVPVQVCLDNNGDSFCGDGPPAIAGCEDDIWLTHTDDGGFIDPIGPLPTSYPDGCRGNGDHGGYVVVACEAVHAPEGAPGHEHVVTGGTVTAYADTDATGAAPSGDFCQAGGPGTAAPTTPSVPLGVPPAAVAALIAFAAVGLRSVRRVD